MTRKRTSTDKSTTIASPTQPESDAPVETPKIWKCKSGELLTEGKWSGLPHFHCQTCGADILKKPWEIECKPSIMVDKNHHTTGDE